MTQKQRLFDSLIEKWYTLEKCERSEILENKDMDFQKIEPTKRVQITLPLKLLKQLEDASKKYNISKSNQISLLISKYQEGEFGKF